MEKAISFTCQADTLLGIIHQPENAADVAVLIVVGGPQYRVGSHRQFVQLSRFLADNGVSSMRFDYRGMGDSEGQKQSFDQIDEDIRAAVDTLCQEAEVSKVVIWGLCDAASAAIMYANSDERVVGLVLLNPWLKSVAAQGKTMVRHYYLKRLMSKAFWQKLLSGNVNIKASVQDAGGHLSNAVKVDSAAKASYQQRMKEAVSNMSARCCLIISGVDLTAKEFMTLVKGDPTWKAWLKKVTTHEFEHADHTFSNRQDKQKVESATLNFILQLSRKA